MEKYIIKKETLANGTVYYYPMKRFFWRFYSSMRIELGWNCDEVAKFRSLSEAEDFIKSNDTTIVNQEYIKY